MIVHFCLPQDFALFVVPHRLLKNDQCVSFCKTQCDASAGCKGYVGPVYNEVSESNGCQFATTENECPMNCSLLDRGVGVNDLLSRGDKAISTGYPGCFIKLKRKLL